jgi:hypothetical protein
MWYRYSKVVECNKQQPPSTNNKKQYNIKATVQVVWMMGETKEQLTHIEAQKKAKTIDYDTENNSNRADDALEM